MSVPIFDRERTIIDAFRLLSIETAVKALKKYLTGDAKNIDLLKLQKYAEKLRVDIISADGIIESAGKAISNAKVSKLIDNVEYNRLSKIVSDIGALLRKKDVGGAIKAIENNKGVFDKIMLFPSSKGSSTNIFHAQNTLFNTLKKSDDIIKADSSLLNNKQFLNKYFKLNDYQKD